MPGIEYEVLGKYGTGYQGIEYKVLGVFSMGHRVSIEYWVMRFELDYPGSRF